MYLNTHSYYSMRYGTLSPERVVELAKKAGVHAMALTDINNSTAIIDYVKLAVKAGIKPIAGIEFRIKEQQLYTGIAYNNEGFKELNEFLTHHNLNKEKLPEQAPVFNNALLVYPFGAKSQTELKENEYIGVKPLEVRKLFASEFRHNQEKLLIWQPVSFANTSEYELHQNLRAIDHNSLITKLRPDQCGAKSEIILPVDRLLKYYEDYPQIIRNTEKVLDQCSIEFDYRSLKNKKNFTGNKFDDRVLLNKLANDGFNYRYATNNNVARQRLEHELEVIDQLGFSAYFLITWDIIRYSMSRGFYHVGRGSGANSIVAYCLRITDVDPIELNLYFERFLNPKRTSPPDFDIDYSWKERDQVTDYIFKRYGRKHTALLGTITTFKGKSILRELGKVHGLPKFEIDRLVDHPNHPDNNNEITRKIQQIGNQMVDFPNMRSIHAGGILVSEEPITAYTALDMPPKGFPTTQWDMYVAEDIGFEKLDILSQRGIGHIKEAADIVKENRNITVDVHDVKRFKQDKQVRLQLRTGETNGCFYVESPAMRGLLKKLHCEDYLTLVAASSIIRPGVARSGMMKEYIQRFHKPDSFKYIHPVMKEQLQETYGVMVYQEDVLKICHHFADLDLADADVLRRAMSGKYRSRKEFERIVDKFFSNCRDKGFSEEIIKEVWRQIESFAGYSFSKAHSASYAVESFQSLYLKSHYPLEFQVAVINNFGGFYHTWVYFNEARRQGGQIQLPCLNNSEYKTCLRGKDIYPGFIHIANLESRIGKLIPQERAENGAYLTLEDFVERIPIGLEQLLILVRMNAFRFTGLPKARLMWDAHMMLGHAKKQPPRAALFAMPLKNYKLPELIQSKLEDAYDEIELLGFPVSVTWFDMLKSEFRGEVLAKDMMTNVGRKVRMLGTLVTRKFVRTVKKEVMNFGTFVDVSGEFFDSVHFPKTLEQYPFRGMGVYLLLGTITEEFGYASITVEKMAKMPVNEDPRNK